MINYFWLLFDAIFCVIFCEYIRDDIKTKKIDVVNIICLMLTILDVLWTCYKIFKQDLN